MRFAGLAVLAMGLGGCVTTASNEEKEATMKAEIACFRAAAERLDDGKSDPLTIGIAMQTACTPEIKRTHETFGRGLPLGAYQRFEEKSKTTEIEMATTVVLQRRKSSGG